MEKHALHRPSSNAFTLLELLVTVAIIAILIAIALPALSRVQERSKAVLCTNNLRQHISSLVIFTAEHDGYLPYMTQATPPVGLITYQYWWTTTTGTGLLMPTPVIKQQASPQSPVVTKESVWPGWYCPMHARELIAGEYRVGYAINSKVVTNIRRKLAGIASPAKVPFLFCFYNKGESLLMGNYYANPIDDPGTNLGYRFYNGVNNAHNGQSTNFAFLDGHVEATPRLGSREDYQKAFKWSATD